MPAFQLSHDFRASSREAFWRCYFDPEHIVELDAAVAVKARIPIEERDEGDVLHRAVKLVPERQLPGFLRKITGAEFSYVERTTFYRRDHRIEFVFEPSFFTERTTMIATYTVEDVGGGVLRRTYRGEVRIDVPLIGARVERAVVADIERSLALAAASTQSWLDRHESSS